MDAGQILQALDAHIEQLFQARALITQSAAGAVSSTATASIAKRGGRPQVPGLGAEGSTGKRRLSAEGKARIAAAQKKRWAKIKRAKVAAVLPVRKTSAESPKKAATKKPAGTKTASVVREAKPPKQAGPIKKAASVKKAAGKKTIAAKKTAGAAKATLTNKRARSPQKPGRTAKNAEVVSDSVVQSPVDAPVVVPSPKEITETTA